MLMHERVAEVMVRGAAASGLVVAVAVAVLQQNPSFVRF